MIYKSFLFSLLGILSNKSPFFFTITFGRIKKSHYFCTRFEREGEGKGRGGGEGGGEGGGGG